MREMEKTTSMAPVEITVAKAARISRKKSIGCRLENMGVSFFPDHAQKGPGKKITRP
jgi:hypothetical protein